MTPSPILRVLPREALLAPNFWRFSPPIPQRARPPAPERAAREPGLPEREMPVLWQALDWIAAHAVALGRDEWRDIAFAVHWATGGSDAGLERMLAFSQAAPGWDEEAEGRLAVIWDGADERRAGGITAATVFKMAAGVTEPLSGVAWANPATVLAAVPDPDEWGVVGAVASTTQNANADNDLAYGTGMAPTTPAGLNASPAPIERRGIPEAQHLCTDQANARRLVASYGGEVLIAAGKWYVWDGRRWKEDESDAYRRSCRLSAIVKDEARDALVRGRRAFEQDGAARHMERAQALSEALEKWSSRCEMAATINAAMLLVRKMLTVPVDLLDRDPWLLNCRNGVVDLRTGAIRQHRADDYITKLADLDYDPQAACPTWERALVQITGEEAAQMAQGRAPIAEFLQRWFGYCATGLTREQFMVVHWGDGSNGKSTVLETIARVLGDYAGTAAPGLVIASEKGERHPTEIAALVGRRMVTAHESREGVQLREDFVKQATGGDRLTARFMREDFFEFTPTHKLQLATNHKPVIKGQDLGIWRRVGLVPYREKFGSIEQIEAGDALTLKDMELPERLALELPGVLAWMVRGAVEWSRRGLCVPDAVLAASRAYRDEQDRVRQFVGECCEVDASASEPMTAGMVGLYPAYCGWCKEGGFFALSRMRFSAEIQRVVPRCRVEAANFRIDGGRRRSVTLVHGVRLLMAD